LHPRNRRLGDYRRKATQGQSLTVRSSSTFNSICLLNSSTGSSSRKTSTSFAIVSLYRLDVIWVLRTWSFSVHRLLLCSTVPFSFLIRIRSTFSYEHRNTMRLPREWILKNVTWITTQTKLQQIQYTICHLRITESTALYFLSDIIFYDNVLFSPSILVFNIFDSL